MGRHSALVKRQGRSKRHLLLRNQPVARSALQPPHLTAMVPWEGAADMYREWYRHGGILSNKFMETWYPRQVKPVQHGNPEGPKTIG